MLSDKDRELIGIGASIAAGCQPFAHFHLRAAAMAGASDAEIGRAVNDARRICREAKEDVSQEPVGPAPEAGYEAASCDSGCGGKSHSGC